MSQSPNYKKKRAPLLSTNLKPEDDLQGSLGPLVGLQEAQQSNVTSFEQQYEHLAVTCTLPSKKMTSFFFVRRFSRQSDEDEKGKKRVKVQGPGIVQRPSGQLHKKPELITVCGHFLKTLDFISSVFLMIPFTPLISRLPPPPIADKQEYGWWIAKCLGFAKCLLIRQRESHDRQHNYLQPVCNVTYRLDHWQMKNINIYSPMWEVAAKHDVQ
ncbi:hypothetical protein F2P81_019125 [Scophthalmus maximus]|uniref:Uncharacterized protein n=1 Tax=Scophthalmus maximus TaxID=52904 RepID=A0A6A4S748_SCOMX|nr:hypothetical protein F2P81_019125 [Scophthalmus maximus]